MNILRKGIYICLKCFLLLVKLLFLLILFPWGISKHNGILGSYSTKKYTIDIISSHRDFQCFSSCFHMPLWISMAAWQAVTKDMYGKESHITSIFYRKPKLDNCRSGKNRSYSSPITKEKKKKSQNVTRKSFKVHQEKVGI